MRVRPDEPDHQREPPGEEADAERHVGGEIHAAGDTQDVGQLREVPAGSPQVRADPVGVSLKTGCVATSPGKASLGASAETSKYGRVIGSSSR